MEVTSDVSRTVNKLDDHATPELRWVTRRVAGYRYMPRLDGGCPETTEFVHGVVHSSTRVLQQRWTWVEITDFGDKAGTYERRMRDEWRDVPETTIILDSFPPASSFVEDPDDGSG